MEIYIKQLTQELIGFYKVISLGAGYTFVEPAIGYCIFGNEIYKTTDSGTNWSFQDTLPSPYYRQLEFVNNSTAFYLENSLILYKTTDSGINWSLQDTMPEIQYFSLGIIKFFNSIIGYSLYQADFVPNKFILYKTTDSGINWAFQDTLTFPSNGGFVNNNWIFVDSNIFYSLNYSQLYKTTDSGINWTLQNDSVSPRSFSFVNSNIGYSVDGLGNIFKTTDSGINWSPIYSFFICRNSNIFFNGNINSNDNISTNPKRKLQKTVDLLGRESKLQKNIPFIKIYDDGTVEKKITID